MEQPDNQTLLQIAVMHAKLQCQVLDGSDAQGIIRFDVTNRLFDLAADFTSFVGKMGNNVDQEGLNIILGAMHGAFDMEFNAGNTVLLRAQVIAEMLHMSIGLLTGDFDFIVPSLASAIKPHMENIELLVGAVPAAGQQP